MADDRFFPTPKPVSVGEIARLTSAKVLSGDSATLIDGVSSLKDGAKGTICFLASKKFLHEFETCKADACFVKEAPASTPSGMALLCVENPALAFAKTATHLYGVDAVPGIHPTAVIDATARIGDGCRIDAGAVIEAKVDIGANSHICANAVIGSGTQLGTHCKIGPNSSVSHALLGDRVTLHSCVSIGDDGFGFEGGADGHYKIPQLGRVIIQDDVEIGSGSAIDRGALQDTVIGAGTKIDNLVQIGHNCEVGRHCILAGHSGLSGSVTLGDFVIVGGYVGIADHAKIASGVQIAGKSGVPSNLSKPGVYGGIPAKPMADWRREVAVINRLVKQSRNKPKQ